MSYQCIALPSLVPISIYMHDFTLIVLIGHEQCKREFDRRYNYWIGITLLVVSTKYSDIILESANGEAAVIQVLSVLHYGVKRSGLSRLRMV